VSKTKTKPEPKIDPVSLAALHVASSPRYHEVLTLIRDQQPTVGELNELVDVTSNQVTNCLRVLRLNSLVDYDRFGSTLRYFLTPTGSQALGIIQEFAGVTR
jgi:predicted transcriptional regulator